MPIFFPKWVIYLVKAPWNRHNFASVNNWGTFSLWKPLQTLTWYKVWCHHIFRWWHHLLGGCLLKIHEGSPIKSLWVNAQVDISKTWALLKKRFKTNAIQDYYGLMKIKVNFDHKKVQYYEMVNFFGIKFSNMIS